MEAIDVATLRTVVGIVGGLLGWVALRMERFGLRLVRVETKLENGLTEKLTDLKKSIEDHIDGEEQRILSFLETSRRLGRLEESYKPTTDKVAALAVKKRKR